MRIAQPVAMVQMKACISCPTDHIDHIDGNDGKSNPNFDQNSRHEGLCKIYLVLGEMIVDGLTTWLAVSVDDVRRHRRILR